MASHRFLLERQSWGERDDSNEDPLVAGQRGITAARDNTRCRRRARVQLPAQANGSFGWALKRGNWNRVQNEGPLVRDSMGGRQQKNLFHPFGQERFFSAILQHISPLACVSRGQGRKLHDDCQMAKSPCTLSNIQMDLARYRVAYSALQEYGGEHQDGESTDGSGKQKPRKGPGP